MSRICICESVESIGDERLSLNNTFRIDPTRTTMLRRRFVAEMDRRFNVLKRDIKTSIMMRDCFGIQPDMLPSPGSLASLSAASWRAFDFPRSPDKVTAFMAWLQEQVEMGILEIIQRPGVHFDPAGSPWTNLYIDPAYQKGIRRSRAELIAKGYQLPVLDNMPGGIAAIMSQPFHAERVAAIYTRTFEDLRSVTQVMGAQIRRLIADGLTTGLARGLAEGKNPRDIARELMRDVANRVDKIGITRARMIARTEVIRAHHVATIAEYRQAEAEMQVDVMAEWSTAGYDVCEICQEMALAGPYTLDQIEGMVPAHPNSYAAGTEIYTKDGFVPVERVKVNNNCLSLNPETFDLEYVPVVGTFAHKEKQMVQFLSRTFDMLVTENHQMFTLRRERKWTAPRSWEFIDAITVPKESMFYRSSRWAGYSEPTITVNGTEIETALFAEFMGWWLSEGSLSQNVIVLSQSPTANPDKYERIAEVCSLLGRTSRRASAVALWNDKLYAYLAPQGKQPVRYVPEEVKQLSPAYLRVFLDSFAAGDGHVRQCKPWKGGDFSPEIVHMTSSRRMADGLGECILKAGRCPSFYCYPNAGKVVQHKNGAYAGNFDTWFIRECRTQMARLESRVKRTLVDYDDTAFCVELAKFHTLWVRRNGKTAWSGNCRCCAIPVVKEREG